jgi:hypothetical protein
LLRITAHHRTRAVQHSADPGVSQPDGAACGPRSNDDPAKEDVASDSEPGGGQGRFGRVLEVAAREFEPGQLSVAGDNSLHEEAILQAKRDTNVEILQIKLAVDACATQPESVRVGVGCEAPEEDFAQHAGADGAVGAPGTHVRLADQLRAAGQIKQLPADDVVDQLLLHGAHFIGPDSMRTHTRTVRDGARLRSVILCQSGLRALFTQ